MWSWVVLAPSTGGCKNWWQCTAVSPSGTGNKPSQTVFLFSLSNLNFTLNCKSGAAAACVQGHDIIYPTRKNIWWNHKNICDGAAPGGERRDPALDLNLPANSFSNGQIKCWKVDIWFDIFPSLSQPWPSKRFHIYIYIYVCRSRNNMKLWWRQEPTKTAEQPAAAFATLSKELKFSDRLPQMLKLLSRNMLIQNTPNTTWISPLWSAQPVKRLCLTEPAMWFMDSPKVIILEVRFHEFRQVRNANALSVTDPDWTAKTGACFWKPRERKGELRLARLLPRLRLMTHQSALTVCHR